MSDFKPVNQPIAPMSADPGEEFPFLHTITVVDRVVSVDKPELVQNNIKTETVTLNLDSEWDGLSCIINIGNSDTPTSLIWSGQPVTIPAELMTDIGTLNVSVVGYGDDGALRAVTKKADAIFTVVASGYVEGDEPVPDPTTILGQLTEAADRANQAADRFEQASEDLGDIAEAVEKTQTSETNAKQSETNAAASAGNAAQSASAAQTSAQAAAQSETNAADSATAAQQAVDGFGLEVGTTTTGEPGSDAAVEIQKTGTKYTANFTIPRGDKGESASVEHDGTLTGDGTSGSPLGIINGLSFSNFDTALTWATPFSEIKKPGLHRITGNPQESPDGDIPDFIKNLTSASAFVLVYKNGTSFLKVIYLQYAGNGYTVRCFGKTYAYDYGSAWIDLNPSSSGVSALTSRIATLESELNELAVMQTRLQSLETRVKSLETN